MGVLQRRPGGRPVVFEDEDIPEAQVSLEIHHSIAVGPQHVFDSFGRQVGEGVFVVGGLDNHFVRAEAVHAVVQPDADSSKVALDLERRKLVGDHPHRPAR